MAQGFILDGKRYEWFPLDQLKVRERILADRWLNSPEGRKFTDARNLDDVIAIAEEIDSLADAPVADPDHPDYEAEQAKTPLERQQEHPEFLFSVSVAIWAAKVAAGEQVTLGEEIGRWTLPELDFWADEEPEGKGSAAP